MKRPIGGWLFFFLWIPSWAFALPNDVATSWLKIPTSAREAAMGGAFGAVSDDLGSLGVNPAGLSGMEDPQAGLMQTFWAQGLSFQHLAYGQPLSPDSGGAVGADFINFGQVEKTIVSNGVPVPDGVFSPMALDLYAGYGRRVSGDLSLGGTAKVLYQDITSPTATLALDAGVLIRPPGEGLSLGLVFSNLGGTLSQASLPLQLKAAAAYRIRLGGAGTGTDRKVPEHFITLAAEGDLSLHDTGFSNLRLGSEYWFRGMVAVRAGYRFAPYGDLTGVAGLALGAGLRYRKWELDYALTTQGDMGSTNQISLMTHF
jgi:hypothetical protein